MQELLDEKKAALISERLHDNALLHTCRSVWPQQQEKIESVTACPEDVFCMAAWLTDDLINAEEDIDAMTLVRGLWSAAINDIARWNSNGIVSLADRYIIASTVFRIVATAFSLHWHHHYSDTLRDSILKVIEEKLPKPKDLYEHQQQEEQQEELTMAIVDCADILNDWVNEYIDESESSLTEGIDFVLNPPRGITAPKLRKQQGRKTFDANTFRETFVYEPDGMSKQEIEIRLKMAFGKMRGVLIAADTHYDTFESLMSGKPLDVKIVWKGSNAQLRALFSLLATKKQPHTNEPLVKKPTGGINQILTARFIKEDGTSFTADEIRNAGRDGDMRVVNEVVEYLIPNPISIEDLETQLARLQTEEQEHAEEGRINGKNRNAKPMGTSVSNTPNQRTRITKKRP